MTLTLTPEIERAIDEAARQQGTTPEQVAAATLEAGLRTPTPNGALQAAGDDLRARVKAAQGKFAHISGGSYAFMRNKVYEKLLEERPRW